MSEMNEVNWPSDWATIPLNDVVIRHNSGIYKNRDKYGEGTNIVGVGDLYQVAAIDGQVFRRVPLTASEKHRYLLNEGDLIYGESSLVLDGIARTLCVTAAGAGTAFAWHTRRFSSNRNAVEPKFLYYLLSGDDARRQLMAAATQTALTGITTTGFFRTVLHLPSLSEQRKIARILTTVDNLIEKTEALIEKQKSIKQGMLHDLFTRGVDSTGRLRPSYEDAPHLYKQSLLGWIPNEWEAATLSDEISILHGYAFEGQYFSDRPPGDVLLVPGNFHRDGDLYFESSKIKFYRGPVPPQTVLANGDIVVVMTDLSPRTLILGRFAQIDLPFRVLHNQRIGLIRTRTSDEWMPRFLLNALNDERLRREIILTATGTTVRHTSPTKILVNHILKPTLAEQERIASIIDNLEHRITHEKEHRSKLQELKTGLMQDLLTGKVRVNVDEAEEVTADV